MTDITAGEERLPWGNRRVKVEDCIQATVAYFGLNKAALMGRHSGRRISWPRQIAMRMAREFTSASMPDIAARLGRMNHTTVLCAVRNIARLEAAGHELAPHVEAVRARISDWRATGIMEMGQGAHIVMAGLCDVSGKQYRALAILPPGPAPLWLVPAAGTGKDAADAFARTVPFTPRGMGA